LTASYRLNNDQPARERSQDMLDSIYSFLPLPSRAINSKKDPDTIIYATMNLYGDALVAL
jgi:hypothetical protein